MVVTTRSMAAARPSPSLVHALPHDVVVEISGLVAATSSCPMDDLCSLRASCRAMHAACGYRAVGRLVALQREAAAMRWADHDRYLAVVGNLSGAGNPEACLLAGITLVFVHRRERPAGAELLERAAAAGHKVAAYVLAVLLYTYNGDAASDDVARQHIRQVEDEKVIFGGDVVARCKVTTKNLRSNKECVRCRAQALEAVRQATWKMAELPAMVVLTEFPPGNAGYRCQVSVCGALEAWSDSAVFCSEDCRIKHECATFISQLPLTVANFVA